MIAQNYGLGACLKNWDVLYAESDLVFETHPYTFIVRKTEKRQFPVKPEVSDNLQESSPEGYDKLPV